MMGLLKKALYSLFLFLILLLSHHFSQDLVIRPQSVIDPVISWHTYLGTNRNDSAEAIAVDEMGNVYLTGWTNTSWGSPINPYAGGQDVFVAKLDKNGVLLWHTFLGSPRWDEAKGIAVDGNGNVFVAGTSKNKWGMPVHSFIQKQSAFAAKLNSKGKLMWNTFMGAGNDNGMAITLDRNGNVYVGGWGSPFWDTQPVNIISGGTDGWVTKLGSNGKRQWYTSMGATKLTTLNSIAVDRNANIYVVGWGEGPWFTRPIIPYSGDKDAFVAKLDNRGLALWHTFLGSQTVDFGFGVALDGNDNVFVSGSSGATWGNPINPTPRKDVGTFIAKLNSNGRRLWNTFLGSLGGELGWAVTADQMGNAYTAGVSTADRDGPYSHHGLFTAKLNHNGAFLWNTFHKAISGEGNSIVLDKSGNIHLGGRSDQLWGDPVESYVKRWDAFAAKIDRGIRVVSWNLLNYSGMNETSRDEAIRKIIDLTEPDVIVIQEMESSNGVDHFLKKVLNKSSRRKYKAAPFYDGPDTDNALFYDKSRLNLKSTNQIPTTFRDISEYSLNIKKGPSEGAKFMLYSVHFTEGRSLSHKKRRESQANTLRTYLNGLSMDSDFLVCGTFNMTTSEEKGYKILTGNQTDSSSGNNGRLKDLIKKSGKWYNRTKFKHTHTESTRKAKVGDGSGDGLNDRYDMILVSYGLVQGSGLSYLPGSYVVCGNDGTHLNKSVNDPENKMVSAEIADALYEASDHLPVIIDLVSMKAPE